jgi:hypothetical protein
MCIMYRRILDYANLADGRGNKHISFVFTRKYYHRVWPKGQKKPKKTSDKTVDLGARI